MAYSFGGGVNASLGATDYGSFNYGAQMGAQSRLQGGKAIGQGIASAGHSIGQGMQASQDLKERNKAATGAVKQAASLGKALKDIEGVPEGLKSTIAEFMNMADNPDISVSEKAAAAQIFLSEAPKVLSLGMQAAEAQSRQRQAESEAKDHAAFNQAVAMATDTEGKIDLQALPNAFRELGGADIQKFVPTIKMLRELSGDEAFQPTGQQVDVPGFGPVSTISTSRGGVQVLTPPSEVKPPAAVETTKFREQEFQKVAELFKAGEKDKALAKAHANGMRGWNGLITMSELQAVYDGGEPAASRTFDSSGPVQISSDEEWKALKPGTVFIGPDGKTRTK
jgi:hypothetical protein